LPDKSQTGTQAEVDKEALKQAAAEKPGAFLKELAKPSNCTATAVFYALENLNMARKKRPLPITRNRKSGGPSMPQG
jgi:hypothetical protein